jgi:hypothetical protein
LYHKQLWQPEPRETNWWKKNGSEEDEDLIVWKMNGKDQRNYLPFT